jgi:hypothetical protein
VGPHLGRQPGDVLLEQPALGQPVAAGLHAAGREGQAVGEEVVVDLAVLGDVDAVPVALVGGREPVGPVVVVAQQVGGLVHPHGGQLGDRGRGDERG